MAERSESEVSAAITEVGRKLGNELRERQQEVVAKFVRGRDVFVLLPTEVGRASAIRCFLGLLIS